MKHILLLLLMLPLLISCKKEDEKPSMQELIKGTWSVRGQVIEYYNESGTKISGNPERKKPLDRVVIDDEKVIVKWKDIVGRPLGLDDVFTYKLDNVEGKFYMTFFKFGKVDGYGQVEVIDEILSWSSITNGPTFLDEDTALTVTAATQKKTMYHTRLK